MNHSIQFTLNGKLTSVHADGEGTLLWLLRSDLDLTGTKYGCGIGMCGACSVLVDGQLTRSCLVPLRDVAGKQITTIEGLAPDGKLHPLQQAFIDHGAFQCGYCTPGMLLAAHVLLQKNSKPTRTEIVAHMDGSLCRCGAHQRIIEAIASVGGAKEKTA